jgi:putative transposase
LIFLTNDFENTAQVIADIYKARWDIELFFKTIKQNLKIKRFFGTTRNAVPTQVWIVMIAYLIHQFLQISA